MEQKIWFKVGKVKDDIKNCEDNQYVAIMKGDKQIGRIFSPSSSSENIENAIQICGFSEAFDLWGCVMDGYKDIQLLFDEKQYTTPKDKEGTPIYRSVANCDRCFSTPCCCEIPTDYKTDDWKTSNPFIVKREGMLKYRLKYKPHKE